MEKDQAELLALRANDILYHLKIAYDELFEFQDEFQEKMNLDEKVPGEFYQKIRSLWLAANNVEGYFLSEALNDDFRERYSRLKHHFLPHEEED